MTDKPATRTRGRGYSRRGLRSVLLVGCATLFSALVGLVALVDTAGAYSSPREQYVPVLGVTMGKKPEGLVVAQTQHAGALGRFYIDTTTWR